MYVSMLSKCIINFSQQTKSVSVSYPREWTPFPRKRCGNRGHTYHRTSFLLRDGAAHTLCKSYTPYTATGRFLLALPALHSCPSRTGDLNTQTGLHQCSRAHTHSTINIMTGDGEDHDVNKWSSHMMFFKVFK